MGRVKTVDDVALGDRRVLCRVDFNVPLAEGAVADSTRIEAALPTLNRILEQGGKLVLMSHLGRPKGRRVAELTLRPVAARLAELLGRPVEFVEQCVGPEVVDRTRAMPSGGVLLLENLRFHAEETANDPEFAARLAEAGDVYVNDAFGTAHRAHASTEGVAHHLDPALAGLLMSREIEYLGKLERDPDKPYVAVLGGAKVSDKIVLLERLLSRVDRILVGGAMAYTFLRARGVDTGASRVEEERLEVAARILSSASASGVEFFLPVDHVVAPALDAADQARTTDGESIGAGAMGLDIGPRTIEAFCAAVADARTVLWNGPLGLFEQPAFAEGTRRVGAAIEASSATSVVGGGDSAAAARRLGIATGMTHISTGGGAALELLSGEELPGLKALGFYG